MATQAALDTINYKIVLQYPTGMVYDDEYVLFRINTDKATTNLREDAEVVLPATDPLSGSAVIQPGTGNSTPTPAPVAKTRAERENLKTLNKVIVLPMPNDHNLRQSVVYNDNYIPSAITKLGDALMNDMSGSMAKELFQIGVAKGVSGLANRMKSGSLPVDDILAQNRLVYNPKKEVMFDSFGFRSFNLQYMFAPKSEQEAKAVRDIIETFRYYSLPEISKAKLFYIFPSEFEIWFMKGNKENTTIPRITSCVLKSINVNYTPQSLWASLPDGSPVSMVMSMEFLELELIDRLRVKNETDETTSGF